VEAQSKMRKVLAPFCRILPPVLLAVAAPAFASEPLAGNYTLSDVADVGGELRLQADGQYEWLVSSGPVARASAGRWSRSGDVITLTPDDPENPSGMAIVPPAGRWDDDAERRFLRTRFENEWIAVQRRCPLIRVRTPEVDAPPNTTPDQARSALNEAKRARRTALTAIAQWNRVSEGSQTWDARLKTASDALAAYRGAVAIAEAAHERANLPPPEYQPIDFPARCAFPKALPAYEPLPAVRHPQIGIIVGNPEMLSAYIGAKLRVRFSDGSHIEAVSGPGGWTSLPLQPGKSVSAVQVAVEYGDPVQFTVPANLAGAGVLMIDINPEAFAIRRLEPTALAIAQDGKLRPSDGRPGVYVPRLQ
jgi:hypothetical protein